MRNVMCYSSRAAWRSRVPCAIAFMALSAVGCTVGPNYRRPPVTPPSEFRGAPAATSPASASLAEQPWADVFQDDQLRALLRVALAQNYDLRIAAARVVEAQASYGVTRADQFPEVDAQAQAQDQYGSVFAGRKVPTGGSFQLATAVSWEPDFWGQYRRATEAARAQILASEWGRRGVLTSLVAHVASGYYALRALDLQLEIARRTLTSRQESLELTQVRERGGATSILDVRQAEQLVHSAEAQAVDLQRQIEQQENALSVLLGQNPGSIARASLPGQTLGPDVPAGVPSTLLERRPDVQQAEQQLVAANARIGVARAAYFPQISLTGTGGAASAALSSLLTSGMWSVATSAVRPIFDAGRTKSRVAQARARTEEAVLTYQRTTQQAFREVSDALVGYQRARELRAAQDLLVRAAEDARRLTDVRYRGGASSYLDVLDSETRLFSAELGAVQAQLVELSAFVEIYRALGGGWQP
jgi:outer membrane protein, multidrug efflux system